MALPIVSRKLEAFGLNPKLRHHPDGLQYITDEGNFILDCSCGEIINPAKTAAKIRASRELWNMDCFWEWRRSL